MIAGVSGEKEVPMLVDAGACGDSVGNGICKGDVPGGRAVSATGGSPADAEGEGELVGKGTGGDSIAKVSQADSSLPGVRRDIFAAFAFGADTNGTTVDVESSDASGEVDNKKASVAGKVAGKARGKAKGKASAKRSSTKRGVRTMVSDVGVQETNGMGNVPSDGGEEDDNVPVGKDSDAGAEERDKIAVEKGRGKAKTKASARGQMKACELGGEADDKKAKGKSKAKAAGKRRRAKRDLVEDVEKDVATPPSVKKVAEEGNDGSDIVTPAKKPRKYLQAQEFKADDGRVRVEVLCPKCRPQSGSVTSLRQGTISSFFGTKKVAPEPVVPTDVAVAVNASTDGAESDVGTDVVDVSCDTIVAVSSNDSSAPTSAATDPASVLAALKDESGPARFSHGAARDGEGKAGDMLFCSRCLAPLHDTRWGSSDQVETTSKTRKNTACPLKSRLTRYKNTATDMGVAWTLTDAEALSMMREPCVLCGEKPDMMLGKSNGITRLRKNGGQRNMGPFSVENTATACSVCNSMKGCHNLDEMRKISRTIATHQGAGNFGSFPEEFRDNTSKRCRSAYFGSHKTHALTNAQFDAIVSKPCYYCGKTPEKGKHHNGLDRLDNSVRVYTESTCVSCCGTCNMAKTRHSVELFLRKCKEIAEKAVQDL